MKYPYIIPLDKNELLKCHLLSKRYRDKKDGEVYNLDDKQYHHNCYMMDISDYMDCFPALSLKPGYKLMLHGNLKDSNNHGEVTIYRDVRNQGFDFKRPDYRSRDLPIDDFIIAPNVMGYAQFSLLQEEVTMFNLCWHANYARMLYSSHFWYFIQNIITQKNKNKMNRMHRVDRSLILRKVIQLGSNAFNPYAEYVNSREAVIYLHFFSDWGGLIKYKFKYNLEDEHVIGHGKINKRKSKEVIIPYHCGICY